MASTVRVTERADEALETLAARLYLKTRVKITKQELVEILAALGHDHEDTLVARVRGQRSDGAKAAWDRVLKQASRWGVRTNADDIDRVLYGEGE